MGDSDKIPCVDLAFVKAEVTGVQVPDLRSVVKIILAELGETSVSALARRIGFPQQTVQGWFASEKGPKLEVFSQILGNIQGLQANPVDFFLRHERYRNPGLDPNKLVYQSIAALMPHPEVADLLLRVLQDLHARGALESTIRAWACQQDVDPQAPVRDIRKSVRKAPKKKL